MARESSLWKWLSGARLVLRDDLHMTRVENMVGAGMLDVEGHLRGQGQFWIELKSSPRPARPLTPVRFKTQGREAQIEWARRRRATGGLSWFLLQVGDRGARQVYLLPGDMGADIHEGLMEHELAQESYIGRDARPEAIIRGAATWR